MGLSTIRRTFILNKWGCVLPDFGVVRDVWHLVECLRYDGVKYNENGYIKVIETFLRILLTTDSCILYNVVVYWG